MRIRVPSRAREQLIDITAQVQEQVSRSGVHEGVIHLWSMHTTCALTVNEGADPDVASDIIRFLRSLVPQDARFDHAEGNSDAHVKVALTGPGLTLIIEDGRILLGTWQKVFLAEFDGPREREIGMRILT